MISAKCQSRSFLLPSLHKALILTTIHRQECLSGSLGIQQRSYSITEEWKIGEYVLKRVRRAVSLYPCCTFPKAARFSAKRDTPVHFSMRVSENVGTTCFLQLDGLLSKGLTSFSSYPEYRGDWHGWGIKRQWEHRREVEHCSNQGLELTRGSEILLAASQTLSANLIPAGPQVHPTIQALQPHCYSWLSMHNLIDSECEHVQKARLIFEISRRYMNLTK